MYVVRNHPHKATQKPEIATTDLFFEQVASFQPFFYCFSCFFPRQVAKKKHIYHDCFYKNADGTNRIIATNKKCVTPTSKCFWKDPNDVEHGEKTSSRANSERVNRYFSGCQKILRGGKYKAIDFFVIK